MRTPAILQSTSRPALAFALAVMACPALAQTEPPPPDAEPTGEGSDCGAISDGAERQACIDRRPASTAPATAAPQNDAIIVTGSRIPKPNIDTVQPSIVIDSTAIEQRGFENVAQALNELPVFGIPGNSPVGAAQSGVFGTGQSFVNFFGLGDQRTLVLVNSRRFISSNTSGLFGATSAGQQVDLGQINTKLIDRVETIAIGGAPIYGSDAIAGTINVILKHDYQGLDVDAQYGISSRGDARNYRIRALAGQNFLDGRANLTASAEYNRGKGFVFADRKVLSTGLFYDACDPGSQYNQCIYPDSRLPAVSESGVPLVGGAVFGLDFPLSPQQMNFFFGDPTLSFGVQDASGNDLRFDRAGNLIPTNYGSNPGGPDNFTLFQSGGNGFDLNSTSQALSDTKRYNANLIGHLDIADNVRLFGEAWYSHSESVNLRSQPVYNSGVFAAPGAPGGNVILSIDNAFLTPTQRAVILSNIQNNPLSDQNFLGVEQDYFYFGRANTDLYPGRAPFKDDLTRFVLGLDGTFTLFDTKWNWEIVGNRGRSHSKGRELQINEQNFQNAVQAVTDGAGNIVCAPHTNSPFPTLSSQCAPLNLFGQGQASQAALNYILSEAGGDTINTQTVFTADVAGALFALPGGDASIALGVETRQEKSDFQPSAFYRGGPDPDPLVDSNGDGVVDNDLVSFYQGVPIQPVKGKFRTKEIFGEFNADLVSPSNNVPGIYRLDFQSAARYVHHSVAGNDVTWTVGARYAPVRDITFRGNFTHAIRAPSIQETTIPTSNFFNFATDPCDVDNIGNGPDPATRAANCAAAGIAPGFQSTAASASFTQGVRGNPDLKNERSNAFSLGGVFTPRFLPRFTLTADYVSVRLRDAISNFTATQVLNACYDSATFPDNEFCGLIRRNTANDQLTFVNTSFFNADQLTYRGLVVALDYKFKTPFLGSNSSMGLNGSYQRLFELTTKAGADNATTNNDGTLGYPKNSAVLTVNYLNGPISLFANFNYTGAVDQGVDEAENFREHQRLKAILYTNVGFRLDVKPRFRLFMDIDNVFDASVPYPVPAFGGSVTYFPGVLGRYFRMGAGVSF